MLEAAVAAWCRYNKRKVSRLAALVMMLVFDMQTKQLRRRCTRIVLAAERLSPVKAFYMVIRRHETLFLSFWLLNANA